MSLRVLPLAFLSPSLTGNGGALSSKNQKSLFSVFISPIYWPLKTSYENKMGICDPPLTSVCGSQWIVTSSVREPAPYPEKESAIWYHLTSNWEFPDFSTNESGDTVNSFTTGDLISSPCWVIHEALILTSINAFSPHKDGALQVPLAPLFWQSIVKRTVP